MTFTMGKTKRLTAAELGLPEWPEGERSRARVTGVRDGVVVVEDPRHRALPPLPMWPPAGPVADAVAYREPGTKFTRLADALGWYR